MRRRTCHSSSWRSAPDGACCTRAQNLLRMPGHVQRPDGVCSDLGARAHTNTPLGRRLTWRCTCRSTRATSSSRCSGFSMKSAAPACSDSTAESAPPADPSTTIATVGLAFCSALMSCRHQGQGPCLSPAQASICYRDKAPGQSSPAPAIAYTDLCDIHRLVVRVQQHYVRVHLSFCEKA